MKISNQDEIIQYIRSNVFENSTLRGGQENFCCFMQEYGEYLGELRKNTSHGVLGCVEKEIREHYQENITLKEFSKKYFVNSAYLGQMFRKQYGISFKEYLNNYRIEKEQNIFCIQMIKFIRLQIRLVIKTWIISLINL